MLAILQGMPIFFRDTAEILHRSPRLLHKSDIIPDFRPNKHEYLPAMPKPL